MERALAAYNAESGDAAPIAIDVNRHPFSFETDALEKGVLGSWQAVLRESGNAWHQDGKHTRLNAQGAAAGITFVYDADFSYHPVDSQRLLLWAARQGRQEQLAEELSTRHFEHAESVNTASVLLDAAQAAGLDRAAAADLLATDELRDEVWGSYSTLSNLGLTAIPLFVFTQSLTIRRPEDEEAITVAKPYVFSGSGSEATFRKIFAAAAADAQTAADTLQQARL